MPENTVGTTKINLRTPRDNGKGPVVKAMEIVVTSVPILREKATNKRRGKVLMYSIVVISSVWMHYY